MTKLKDILDERLLNAHLANGMVKRQKHPSLPLFIYNYTQKAQFEPAWGDGTIDYCRGLIADVDGNIVARPFKKFHNLNTPGIPETLMAHLPNVKPTITEKVDGSLGILWRYENYWGIATRGSFTSDQAIWATNWYAKGIQEGRLSLFQTSEYNPLFEIIYKENRIVLNYDFEGLVLLALVNKHNGQEQRQDIVEEIGGRRGFTGKYVVRNHGMRELSETEFGEEAGREGLVLTFNEQEGVPPIKVKVKFEEYVRLHKIVTGVSPKAIWETLAKGESTAFINDTPEHFQKWATSWVDKLYNDFTDIHHAARDIYDGRPTKDDDGDIREYRKMCAAYFTEEVKKTGKPEILGVCFAFLDNKVGKEMDAMISKLVKPRGDDQSFRTEGE